MHASFGALRLLPRHLTGSLPLENVRPKTFTQIWNSADSF